MTGPACCCTTSDNHQYGLLLSSRPPVRVRDGVDMTRFLERRRPCPWRLGQGIWTCPYYTGTCFHSTDLVTHDTQPALTCCLSAQVYYVHVRARHYHAVPMTFRTWSYKGFVLPRKRGALHHTDVCHHEQAMMYVRQVYGDCLSVF